MKTATFVAACHFGGAIAATVGHHGLQASVLMLGIPLWGIYGLLDEAEDRRR